MKQKGVRIGRIHGAVGWTPPEIFLPGEISMPGVVSQQGGKRLRPCGKCESVAVSLRRTT